MNTFLKILSIVIATLYLIAGSITLALLVGVISLSSTYTMVFISVCAASAITMFFRIVSRTLKIGNKSNKDIK